MPHLQRLSTIKASCFRYVALFTLTLTLINLTVSAHADSQNLLMVSVAPTAQQGNAKTVHAKVLIQAPPSLVWEMLTDYPELSDVLPGYERSRVLKSGGNHALLDVAMKVANFLPTYKYQVQTYENEANYQLNMTRVSGDFKSLQATYKLAPQSGGKSTLLTYQLNIDPGFTLPGAYGLIRANTEKSMKALEKHAELRFNKGVIGQR